MTIHDPITQDAETLAGLARALAHPARIRIVQLLAQTPGCMGGEIVEAVGLAQSTVSEHLRILRDAGLIVGEIAPPRICYSLDAKRLEKLYHFINTLPKTSVGTTCCVPAPELGIQP